MVEDEGSKGGTGIAICEPGRLSKGIAGSVGSGLPTDRPLVPAGFGVAIK